MNDTEINAMTDTGAILDKIRELRIMRNDPEQNIWSDNSFEVEASRLFDRLDDLITQGADLPQQWRAA